MSEQPRDDLVICPNCVHQFRAIPIDVQEELARLREGHKSGTPVEVGTGPALADDLIRTLEDLRPNLAPAEWLAYEVPELSTKEACTVGHFGDWIVGSESDHPGGNYRDDDTGDDEAHAMFIATVKNHLPLILAALRAYGKTELPDSGHSALLRRALTVIDSLDENDKFPTIRADLRSAITSATEPPERGSSDLSPGLEAVKQLIEDYHISPGNSAWGEGYAEGQIDMRCELIEVINSRLSVNPPPTRSHSDPRKKALDDLAAIDRELGLTDPPHSGGYSGVRCTHGPREVCIYCDTGTSAAASTDKRG